jgi:hypothetical protein
MFHNARKELVQIQEVRRVKEQASLEEAAEFRQADPQWRPAENGFVHSLPEIDRYIATRQRLNRPPNPRTKAA